MSWYVIFVGGGGVVVKFVRLGVCGDGWGGQ